MGGVQITLMWSPATTCSYISCSPLQLVYCLAHFTGDDKVPPYVNRLVNPGIVTEESNDDDQVLSSLYHDYDEEDYINLLKKDTEALFQDSTYMKHLRRHANK